VLAPRKKFEDAEQKNSWDLFPKAYGRRPRTEDERRDIGFWLLANDERLTTSDAYTSHDLFRDDALTRERGTTIERE